MGSAPLNRSDPTRRRIGHALLAHAIWPALAAVCIALVGLLATGGCTGGFPDAVIYPTIESQPGKTVIIEHQFAFEGEPVTIAVPVDDGLYAGAAAATKTVTRFGNARENDWIEDYYPAFVEETHQDAFYGDVLAAFRGVRDARGLDADRYAELLTVFVQSLEYTVDPVDLRPKYPVETFFEGAGDCDDLSLLLAALLSREGYDVAIMLFEPEQHVALGIRSAGDGYAGTGYEFIETTASGFVGMVPDSFAGGITLTSAPRVVPVGSGSTAYGAADQVRAILAWRSDAIARAEALSAELDAADAELALLQAEVESERAALDALRTANRTEEYNARVSGYNALVAEFNAAVADRNARADRYNTYAEVDRLVVEGLDDRPGTYARVAAIME